MTDRRGTNALVVLGIVLLVVGGFGFVYGQTTVQGQQQSGDGGGGDSLLDVTVDDSENGDGSRSNSRIDPVRVIRLGGLTLGIGGAIIALVGGLVD